MDAAPETATAARMYDYYLGGSHNFAADREAAKQVIAQMPQIPAQARANRGFLRRAVRYLSDQGVRQFLDVGSGIPTVGNVHETAPNARVVYVDLDPIAVALGLEILDGDRRATSILGDLRHPLTILADERVRGLLDFGEPIGLLLLAVLHFVDDDHAYPAVEQLRAMLAPGSALVVSHAASEPYRQMQGAVDEAKGVFEQRTTSQARLRSRDEVERFFTGTELVDPGLVWVTEWRPEPGGPEEFDGEPMRSGLWAGVGMVPAG